MRVAGLIEDNPEEWWAATHHPFLDGVREGALPKGAFEAWLAQDYLFVNDLLVFQSRLLARSPRLAQPAVAGGLAALVDELGWFEEHAGSMKLALDAPRHPTTDAYREFMTGLEEIGYPAGIVTLWAMERAYLEAWRGAAPGHPDYRPFVEHWTVPEFAGYVAALEAAADAVLGEVSGSEREEAEHAFLGVARLEREFWEMAFPGGRGMSLAKTLWEANADLAREALNHRFVRGLADGSLPLEGFQGYVAQDAFFLESFARAYALALVRCKGQQGMRDFAGLISGVIEELELHEGYAGRWDVSLEGTEPAGATLAYTDFLLATASLGDVGETCASMAPCMRLYAFLVQSLAREGVGEGNPYSEWVETYADPGFEALAAKLETMLDRYASDTPAVRSAYRRAMALELGFFEANARG